MSTDALTLFPDYEPEQVPVEPVEKLSADRRRTLRQAALITAGWHSLLNPVYGPVVAAKLHELGRRNAGSTDQRGLPFTCGSCAFRVLIDWHNRSYPKCVQGLVDGEPLDYSPRVSHGTASDVRAWWPACDDYEAGDNLLGPDAMRGGVG